MRRAAQSTAYTVMLKVFLSSDHVTPATSKTVAITLSKAGGAFGVPNAVTNATEVSGGWYKVALDTTDTNTLGDLVVVGTATSCDTADQIIMIVKATNGGYTGIPDAVAEAAGGLYTRGVGAGQINQDAAGRIDANVKTWISGTIPAVNVTGVPLVDAKYLLGTIFSTPTVAGIPNVNAKTWNDLTTVALPLIPTVAGRTLDCSAGGEAGLDWANVGSPTTAVDLSNTTIKTTQKVDVDTIKTNPVVNGGTITFPTTATLASTTNITAGTITTVTNLTNAPTAGDLTATMKTSVQTAADAAVTANTLVNAIAGYIDTEIAAIKAKTDNLPASPAAVGDIPTAVQNADALLNRDMSTGSDSGSPTVRTVRQALRVLRNKVDLVVSAGNMVVYKEDDSTSSWTAALTTSATAAPVTVIDPAGP